MKLACDLRGPILDFRLLTSDFKVPHGCNERGVKMARCAMTDRSWNMVKVAAIVLPWLCAVTLPILCCDGFVLSLGRCVFFLCVMMPFGNLALLGLVACGHGWTAWGSAAVFAFAGIVAPPALALLFAICWRRRQFVLVWLGYLALIAWDALAAMFFVLTLAT